jgi:glycogen debranching enzyme
MAQEHDPVDRFDIRATSERADDRTLVLKQGEMFAVFDRHGDIRPLGLGEQGLYFEGTRFLSRFELLWNDQDLLLLGSTVRDDNILLAVDLTNPDSDKPNGAAGGVPVPRSTLHVARGRFLWEGTCHERLRLTNHGLAPIEAVLRVLVDADFADVFEVRGAHRAQRGERRAEVRDGEVHIVYTGLDGVVRRMRLVADPPPAQATPTELRFPLHLPPQGETTLQLSVQCLVGDRAARPAGRPRPTSAESFDGAFRTAADAMSHSRESDCTVSTSNAQFNDWLARSCADVHMMLSDTRPGPYPHAGVPWFATPFGRDGIITALEYLWVNPALARGVLRYLASTQADATDAAHDAEPGKILHEARDGEMAALGEVPFGRYYGSADATPLFVLLAGAAFARTGDLELARELWPHVERALEWMRDHGDRDGDGLIEYAKCSPTGLVNQGWKDSHDSIFHAGGELAAPPIAPCEIQGYAFAALRSAALLARALGDEGRGRALDEQAEGLRRTIEELYWCEELGSYALALDGRKRPCRVRASNAGHLLFCGVPSPERAARLTETLMDKSSHSGWGIRTVATGEARYNPMAYHNGSVWPHDNALIAAGFGRYGFQDSAAKVLGGLFEASLHMPLRRMPELFCGFTRRQGEGPTSYPLACSPQSWAAASVFLLVQSCLGLSVDALRREVQFFHPVLPAAVRQLRISRLAVADASLDVLLTRDDEDVGVTITRREGRVNVVVVK